MVAYGFGYTDAESLTTIGAGACTYIVGPITGAAIGASSDLIAISIAAGVVKTIFVTSITPLVAKKIGLDNPSGLTYFVVILSEFILISLYNIQDQMEYPFDKDGLDDIKLDYFKINRWFN